MGVDHAIETIAKAIDMIFASDGTDVRIALETLAGKGTEVGTTFEEIQRIISLSKNQNRLGCCMDTCHLSDGGYDITDVEGILDSFDKIIGLNRLLVLHVNDSKNIRGAHKDRHENIGYGEIGFDVLNAYVNNPRLVNVPKILETPYYNEKPPYKEEIEMFKNQKFVPNWRDKI